MLTSQMSFINRFDNQAEQNYFGSKIRFFYKIVRQISFGATNLILRAFNKEVTQKCRKEQCCYKCTVCQTECSK